MEAVKNTDLIKQIAELKTQVEISATIREMVAKFDHYKQVNKRFVDAIEELPGYSASLYEYGGGKKLCVHFNRCSVEVYEYGKELTWERILNNIPNYPKWLEETEKKAACLIDDIKVLQEIWECVKDKKVSNFSLYSIESELRRAIEDSGNYRLGYVCNNWKCKKEHPKELDGTWCPDCDGGYIRDKLIKLEG